MYTKRKKDFEQFASMNNLVVRQKKDVCHETWIASFREAKQAYKEYEREFKEAKEKKVL